LNGTECNQPDGQQGRGPSEEDIDQGVISKRGNNDRPSPYAVGEATENGRSNVRQVQVPALQGTVNFTFKGVPDGTYAISVGHDQNNDGVLERHRFLKYPIEGAGVSNYTEPPRFIPLHHEATFDVTGPVTEVQIPMHYPPDG